MQNPQETSPAPPFADAFRGRSVLVTGHTGFKGSWLARLGAKLTAYSLAPPTNPSPFEIGRVREVLAEHHIADIRDTEKMGAALEQSQADVVLHLAAQSVVRQGYREPLDTFSVNV